MRLPVTHRADDCKREVASVADPRHHHSESEEPRGRLTDQRHNNTGYATDEVTEQNIHRNKPPREHVAKRHGLAELRANEARQKQSKHKLDKQPRGRGRDDANARVRQKRP